jgi:hypothetical protein
LSADGVKDPPGDVVVAIASPGVEKTERLRGVGASVVKVVGLGVSEEEVSLNSWFVAETLPEELVGVLVFDPPSAVLRFRRDDCSLSALSITTLDIRTNSEQMPSMRCTPPCSASWPNIDRNVTTRSMSRVSDLARGSRGFCRMLLNKVMSAETGK